MKQPQSIKPIYVYQILFRIFLCCELLLIIDLIIENSLVLANLTHKAAIVAFSAITTFLLAGRVVLLITSYNCTKWRKSLSWMIKSCLVITILILNSFKILVVANLNNDTSLGLLFANTVVLNLSLILLEGSSYYVLYLKFKTMLKLPTKKDSTVQTKKNSALRPPREMDEEWLKEKEAVDFLKQIKILYVLGHSDNIIQDDVSCSKVYTTEDKEEPIHDIAK